MLLQSNCNVLYKDINYLTLNENFFSRWGSLKFCNKILEFDVHAVVSSERFGETAKEAAPFILIIAQTEKSECFSHAAHFLMYQI